MFGAVKRATCKTSQAIASFHFFDTENSNLYLTLIKFYHSACDGLHPIDWDLMNDFKRLEMVLLYPILDDPLWIPPQAFIGVSTLVYDLHKSFFYSVVCNDVQCRLSHLFKSRRGSHLQQLGKLDGHKFDGCPI